jgi:6-pyruvoyl-tetrahydropterin synthase
MHGHSLRSVSVEGDVGPKTGWVYDHAEISAAMKPLLEMLDHSYLNDIEGLENRRLRKWQVVLEETAFPVPRFMRDCRA